jgi:lipoprotein NlpD
MLQWGVSAMLVIVMLGCAAARHPAPVEQRSPAVRPVPGGTTAAPRPVGTAPAEAPQPPRGAENAGKPGYYTVRAGDTMFRVGLETGQNWRDVAAWNAIDSPYTLEVGQVLRVVPPGVDPAAVAAAPVPVTRADIKPIDPSRAPPPVAVAALPPAPSPAPAAAPAPMQPPVVATPAPAPAPTEARTPDDDINWAWPASGSVFAGFDDARNKGLSIGGNLGDPVLAAADGRVVYSGSGLRGYGNLLIVKHNNTYLTAYAHNQVLLVKEDQVVRRGQKIAEMGASDSDRVKLHFEIRKQGKPVDPARLLPPR